MPLPNHDSPRLDQSLTQILGQGSRAKVLCAGARAQMMAGSVDATQIFALLDNLRAFIALIDAHSGTAGLNAYATAQIPGYAGTLTSDIATTRAALVACIDWVVANFPTAGGYLQSHQINADGTRTQRSFTSAQTAGLRTELSAVLATIA